MISIMLADDHSIVRAGLRLLIESQPDMEVIDEAVDGEEAVIKAIDKEPDIIVMDLNMPRKSGLIATKQINEINSDIKIIVLTMHEDREYIFRVLQAGASSYLLKSHHESDLIDAIRTVHKGDAYLYPNATKLLLEDYMEKSAKSDENSVLTLTGREQEILAHLAKGYTNRDIAEQLFVSIKTIESHRAKIMEKLKLKTRSDLVEYAFKNGLLVFD